MVMIIESAVAAYFLIKGISLQSFNINKSTNDVLAMDVPSLHPAKTKKIRMLLQTHFRYLELIEVTAQQKIARWQAVSDLWVKKRSPELVPAALWLATVDHLRNLLL